MAKVAVPIIKLRYNDADAYHKDIVGVFEDAGVWQQEEDYTFTGRVSISADTPDEEATQRTALVGKVREVLPPRQADRLIALLDEPGWNVSFFVDCW